MITVDAERGTALLLGTRLALTQPASRVVRAVLRATAHGAYEARIGGRPVSDAVLSPGWSSYEWRLQVQEYDVTHLIADVVGVEVLLGNGWWRGGLGFGGLNLDYGPSLGFIAELEVTYQDGTAQVLVTGPHWTARRSSIIENSLYDGVRIDARPPSDEQLTVRTVEFDRSTLVPQTKPAIIRHETLRAVRTWSSPSGKTLVDFGQNLVGWIRLRASGPAGTEITVRHAEVLEHGELATRPLRGARATDTFVLSGGPEDVFEPTLTFHGFRYAEITGHPGDLEAVVVHSDMSRTGTFECSNPLVNRLVENSVWGQRGNLLDLPTDCPQRDERLGWTGDIAVYAPAACYQFDCADVLHGWLLDLAVETEHSGYVPFVVPNVLKHAPVEARAKSEFMLGPTAIWGDAAVWVPESLWHAYGDRDRLAVHYPAMVRHLEGAEARLSPSGLWDTGFQFGDWLDPTAPPDRPQQAKADPGVVATACLYRSARFAAEAAGILGRNQDARRWRNLADRTRDAFVKHYVHDDGTVHSDAQTVYALAIHFGLLDGDLRQAAGDRLAALVREDGHRVATGFAGTPYVTWALTKTGHVDDAYRLLLQEQCPSWLYAVTMDATTIWERWDSLLPDGTVNPGEMTSFNHYALGAVVDWLYKSVAGIRPAEPGYRRILLQPTPGPGLDWAHGALDTPHGRITCGWRRQNTGYDVEISVPEGIEADVVLPDGTRHTVTGGTHDFRSAP
ncbi:family 78 glycoside hydrolase catalytic domain [Nonomuraea sp. FMUSA5-5]|uniref:alpha-L-rhamnosidase n=2 Tax=Nonomuraea composti TaxID=2720023 RepID=A0ABX1B361_9ACTN|nr:family 78 glycoside hydrolase catalytic domain [Nonomuraea sp. FMUSA5-5]NJP90912.1 family 78 glycoside hydrolase catalytic domain [Nonomuraea sp. FMUSA5-5]